MSYYVSTFQSSKLLLAMQIHSVLTFGSSFFSFFRFSEAPFVDDNPFGLYQKILSGKINWPDKLQETTEQ